MAARTGAGGRRRLRAVAALGAAAMLTGGCAADDPRAGGFLGGVVGLTSGRYAREVREKELRLAGLRAEGRELGTAGRRLEAEGSDLAARLEARRREAAGLARAAAELDEAILDLERAADRTERRRAELLEEIERLDDVEPPAGVAPPPPEERPPAAPATGERREDLEGLADRAAELEARMLELQRAAARAAERRAELKAEIDRMGEELAAGARGQPGAAPPPGN